MNSEPKLYRIWNAETAGCVASGVEGATPLGALKSVERYLHTGRYLVAETSGLRANHDEFGVFEVACESVSYTEVKL